MLFWTSSCQARVEFPVTPVIVSATLDIFINNSIPYPLSDTIPIRIDLVSFQPPTLIETDFVTSLQPALATKTIQPFNFPTDFGQHVRIDVTSFMIEAQRLSLPDFQVRILEDFGTSYSPGLSRSTTPQDRMQERLHLCWRSRIIDAAAFSHGEHVEYIDLSEQLQRHKTCRIACI